MKNDYLVSKKYEKPCKANKAQKKVNCTENLLIVVSGITGCVSIAAFTSLVGIPIDIGSSAVGLNSCAITSRTKK